MSWFKKQILKIIIAIGNKIESDSSMKVITALPMVNSVIIASIAIEKIPSFKSSTEVKDPLELISGFDRKNRSIHKIAKITKKSILKPKFISSIK